MRKILLLSDTHSHLDDSVLKYAADCDEIWHGGDFGTMEVADRLGAVKPLKGVYGNIDGINIRVKYPENLVWETGGMKFLMTHIAGPPGKYTPRVRKLLVDEKPDVLICGHSHILKVMRDAAFNTMYMNPGAAGNEGFHKVKTMLRFTVENGAMKDLAVVELGRRGALK